MVPDVVDDGEMRLALSATQAAAELLQPHNARLRWSQHHDGINLRKIDAFVEHVHRANDVEFAAF